MLDVVLGDSLFVPLHVGLAISPNGGFHPRGKGVGTGNADAVETARGFVAGCIAAKLSAGVKNGHNDLKRGNAHLSVLVNRNSAAVVFGADRVISVEGDVDLRTVPGERFVDTVVEYFAEKLVKAALAVVANVHSRSLSDGFKPLQNLDLIGVIIALDNAADDLFDVFELIVLWF
jgi:hypothetical protein